MRGMGAKDSEPLVTDRWSGRCSEQRLRIFL
jgi:hypothetical protein